MSRLVGVISDTHGLLRPEALDALQGVELIIHAGDVGDPEILDRLREVAPPVVVRGNIDRGEWATQLPVTEAVEVKGHVIHVLHDLKQLDLKPAGLAAIITGHTHQPLIERRDGAFFLNPGSAGPLRFTLPITLALLDIDAEKIEARLVDLTIEPTREE